MKTKLVNRTNGEYNVCFQGASLDVGNRGCCALAASFIKLVVESKPNAKIYLLYGNRTNGVQGLRVSGKTVEVDIVNFRLSPRAKFYEHLLWILLLALIQRIIPIKSLKDKIIKSNRWLKVLHEADFVGEIRGGDSFSDIYGLRKFLVGIIPCIIAILMRKELVLLPQTYGPFKSRLAKQVAYFIISRAVKVYSRDNNSIELVGDLLAKKSKHKTVQFCPDIAFVLESSRPEEIDINPQLEYRKDIPLIGLNISGLLYIGGFSRKNMFGLNVDYREFVGVLLKQLLEKTNAKILLVPHVLLKDSDVDELRVCKELFKSVSERYAGRVHLVNREYNQNEIKGIINLCDFFVGARMHACIAAISQCIPTIGLAYSRKFKGVFKSAGVEQFVIDMRQKSTEEIIETVLFSFEQRDLIAKNLKMTIPKIQNQVRSSFKEMMC